MKTKLLILSIVLCGLANAQYTKLLDFAGTANGSSPYGSLISDGTFLYGMTKNGGTNDSGTVFKIKPDGTGYSKLLDFTGSANGSRPTGSLFSHGIFLYGMTTYGGTNGYGTIFKIKPDGTGYSKLLDCQVPAGGNGHNPCGSLIFEGTFLYGMTTFGNGFNSGVLFRIKPDGTGYLDILEFFANPITGLNPYGSVISDGVFLYGMTNAGGNIGSGVIFKIKPDGTAGTNLLQFTGAANGSYPYGSLISDGTSLYGMTNQGGTNGYGTIFKILPNGSGYTKLLDFTGAANGSYPYGSLIWDGTFLYGMTQNGGTNNMGVLFRISPNGTGYAKLIDFAGNANGRNPQGDLLLDGGCLYGMTNTGGSNNMGTIFKYCIATGIAENNSETNFTISPNPFSTQTVFQTDNLLKNATLTVDNCFGQTVAQIKNINGQTVTFSRDNLASGLYFVRLTEENKTIAVDKLVITDK